MRRHELPHWARVRPASTNAATSPARAAPPTRALGGSRGRARARPRGSGHARGRHAQPCRGGREHRPLRAPRPGRAHRVPRRGRLGVPHASGRPDPCRRGARRPLRAGQGRRDGRQGARRPRRRRGAAARRSGQRAAAPDPPGGDGQPDRGRPHRCAGPAPAARRGAARPSVGGRAGPCRPCSPVRRDDRRGRHHPGRGGRRGGRAGGRDHRHAARRASRRAGDGGGARPGRLDRVHRRSAAVLRFAAAGARAVSDRAGDRPRRDRGGGQGGGCSAAEPLGPYPAIGKLVLAKYTTALGIAPQQAQGAPVR